MGRYYQVMKARRLLIGIFSASVTFSFSVALASLWLVLKPLDKTKEVPASTAERITPESNALPRPFLLKERTFPDVWDEKPTAAGKLEIIETEPLEWKITLDGKQIYSDEDLPPQIESHVTSADPPFDEVVVLSQASGTCCEFRRFWFLGLKSDGSYYLSKAIGHGFADMPVITAGKDYVKVRVRGGRENHGEGFLPGGEWVLRNGRVVKLR
jgi:hypothetical protein